MTIAHNLRFDDPHRNEARRRLKLEREVVQRFLRGSSMRILALRHAVPQRWVEDTVRRCYRGTLLV